MRIQIVLVSLAFLCVGCHTILDVKKLYADAYNQMDDQKAITVLRTHFLPSQDASGIYRCGDGDFCDENGLQELEVTSNKIMFKAYRRGKLMGGNPGIPGILVYEKIYYDYSLPFDSIYKINIICYGDSRPGMAALGRLNTNAVKQGGDYVTNIRYLVRGYYQIHLWFPHEYQSGVDFISFAIRKSDLRQVLVALVKLVPKAEVIDSDSLMCDTEL